ncbi:glycosyltransferase [Candidatus Omnitrophota bacterium]
MSKVLAFGAAPLPIENAIVHQGPGIRTWQFVRPLLDEGHQVCLVCLQASGTKPQMKNTPSNLSYYFLSEGDFSEVANIQKLHDAFQPDCIFSISSFLPSRAAVQLKTERPIWFDRGDLMAEAQLKAATENNDDYLYDFWKLEQLVLGRGDVFSTVSAPQRFALIGRLGSAGRLNKYTTGYELINVIPCAVEETGYRQKENIIRAKHVNNDDFVVLWSGGYNTWADIETLFSSLELAMTKNKRIKFVSTGGAISGQDQLTYAHFLKLIAGSKHKDRYIMLGWVPAADLASIYLESDLGINIDKFNYEVVLGSRHRLLDWMQAGLPILTTKPSELTQILDQGKMVFTFPSNNAEFLAQTMLKLTAEKQTLVEYAQRARDFVQRNFSYQLTTEPFRKWVKQPKHAPDKIAKSRLSGPVGNLEDEFRHNIEAEYIDRLKNKISKISAERLKLENERNSLKKHISNLENERTNLKKHVSGLEATRDNLKEHLNNVCNSRFYKLYTTIKNIFKKW